MKMSFERIRRAIWTYRQPLTRIPKQQGAPVSDLFVWRNSPEWETYFELMDIASLFSGPEMGSQYATFFFFDGLGRLFRQQRVDLIPFKRQTIALSEFVSGAGCNTGTFAVFHSHTPPVVTACGAYVTERGYTSYSYRGAPLRAYVHGNLDAIAMQSDGRLQLLGSTSLLRREYRLQHAIKQDLSYELGVVNPTAQAHRVVYTLHSNKSNKVLESQEIKLMPRGSHLFPVHSNQFACGVVTIDSRLVMARPLVFVTHDNQMDVFHG